MPQKPLRKKRRESDSLYIMGIDPGDDSDRRMCRHVFGLKIGRTWDVDERSKTMARAMPLNEAARRVPGMRRPRAQDP